MKQKLAIAKGANKKKPGFSSVFSIVVVDYDEITPGSLCGSLNCPSGLCWFTPVPDHM
jgi:hypothetical protein